MQPMLEKFQQFKLMKVGAKVRKEKLETTAVPPPATEVKRYLADFIRFAFYIVFFYGAMHLPAFRTPVWKSVIWLALCVLAEFLYQRKQYGLFALIIINRILTGIHYYSSEWYSLVETQAEKMEIYYFLNDTVVFDTALMHIAVHLCVIWYLFRPGKSFPIVWILILSIVTGFIMHSSTTAEVIVELIFNIAGIIVYIVYFSGVTKTRRRLSVRYRSLLHLYLLFSVIGYLILIDWLRSETIGYSTMAIFAALNVLGTITAVGSKEIIRLMQTSYFAILIVLAVLGIDILLSDASNFEYLAAGTFAILFAVIHYYRIGEAETTNS